MCIRDRFETDKRDVLSVRIDRKRKQPATLLLRALGLAETREEIIELLGNDEMVLRTLDRDPATTKEESLIELYKRFRPGEPPTIDSARTLLEGLFFNPQRYDLAKVGRYKINKKLGFDPDFEASTLTDEDITKTMQYIVALHAGEAVSYTHLAQAHRLERPVKTGAPDAPVPPLARGSPARYGVAAKRGTPWQSARNNHT